MTRFELSSRPYDKGMERRAASEQDAERWYDEPGVYCVNGEPAIIYGRLPGPQERLLWAVKSLHFNQEKRTVSGGKINSGVRIAYSKKDGLGKSRIFGFRPPIHYNPIGAVPGPTSLMVSHPAHHEIICDLGRQLDSLYQQTAPDVYAEHRRKLETVLPEYVIPGTAFTSGIVNQDNPLKYHFDKGNFDDALSCMAVFRNMMDGGHLVIPELGAGFRIHDHSFFLFDGQRYLHGVTPIRRLNKNAYRYSVVYYALRAMSNCRSAQDELKKVRKNRVDIERRRL
jgi:hypothetical protein